MKKLEKFYERHEHLAQYYASKIWNEHNIGMEREDLVQELKLKLWTSIQAYMKRWKEYKDTGYNKPMQMEFYLRTALSNKCRDFIRKINEATIVPMSQVDFDHGKDDFNMEFDFKNKKLIIGQMDVMENWCLEDKKLFMLYFKGLSLAKIKKIYKGDKNPRRTINMHGS